MADRYEDRSYEDLYELAQEKDIEGRSSMDKEELIAALRGDREGPGDAAVTVAAGTLPPTDMVEVYERTVDGSQGFEGELDGRPVKVFDKARSDGDVVLDGLPTGPVWVKCGSTVVVGYAHKRDGS